MHNYSDDELADILSTPVFRHISATADALGLECYVVGGYVRDLFLGISSDDIDCVVVGSGVQMAKAFAKRLREETEAHAHVVTYQNFGTAQVTWRGQEIEFVGARRESYDRLSRNPIVEDGTLEDDQNRRDFTINAMAICLNAARYGELVDPFGGILDLAEGVLRTPLDPDITFSDDPLRMLRCIRFATRLRFRIDDDTFEALERNAERLDIISQERIAEELNKILLTRTPSVGFVDLQRSALLPRVLPELSDLDSVEERGGRAHKNNFYHTLEVLDNVARATAEYDRDRALWLRWAALLHDIGKARAKRWDPRAGWTFHSHENIGARMVPDIFRRLTLPLGAEMRRVQTLVALHMRPINIADAEVTDSAVRRLVAEAGDDADDLLLLAEADITSHNEVRKQRFRDNYTLVREKIIDLARRDYRRLLQPVVDGNEIMERYGLKPSREVGELKQYMKDAVLDNRVPNEREPLLALLDEKAGQMGIVKCQISNSN